MHINLQKKANHNMPIRPKSVGFYKYDDEVCTQEELQTLSSYLYRHVIKYIELLKREKSIKFSFIKTIIPRLFRFKANIFTSLSGSCFYKPYSKYDNEYLVLFYDCEINNTLFIKAKHIQSKISSSNSSLHIRDRGERHERVYSLGKGKWLEFVPDHATLVQGEIYGGYTLCHL